ncbi:putative ribonuclease H-like domain-containing protein, partial [Tanacetum coccineum]
CPVTILNIIDHLGKFDGKADERLFVGYSTNSKAFRVFNSRTRIVEENLHVQFSENTPNIAGTCDMEKITGKDYILLPLSIQDLPFSSSSKDSPDAVFKSLGEEENKDTEDPGNKIGNPTERKDSEDIMRENNTNNVNNLSSTVNAAGSKVNVVGPKTSIELPNDLNIPELKDIIYSDDDEDVGAEVDINNLDTHILVSPIPTTRIHKDHPVEQIIGDIYSAPQTRRMTKSVTEQAMFSSVQQRTNHKDFQNCLFACFLSQEEPKKMDVNSAFLYGKIEEEVYVYQLPGFEDPDFPAIVYKVEKALYGLHQAPKAWYETLSTYLLDNGFQRGKIDKNLFIRRDKGDILLVQVYVDDIIFGSTKKSLCTDFEKIMHKKFQMSSMGEFTFFLGLQVKQKEDGIFISQDKYVTKILKKFGFSDVKTASTPMETHKPLLKDADGEDVDEHLYRSMIGSLMYLTSSRPNIMFTVCTCARFQVNPKNSHLHAVKRIFRYLKVQSKLGLWYPKDSPFDLVAYTDSDYIGASLDRKSTTGVKNPVFHSKTKHIEIRHHFIRDSNEKKLIQMIKIHTNHNVADLLTKAFDVSRFQYASIGMLNL